MSTAKMDMSKAPDYTNEDSFNKMLAIARGEASPEVPVEAEALEIEMSEEPEAISNSFQPDDNDIEVAEEVPEIKPEYQIPKSRLDEESKRRYEAEEQVRFLMEQNQKLMAMNQKQPEPEINPYDDVLDETTFNYVRKLENEMKQFKQEYSHAQDQAKLSHAVEQSARNFKAVNPDYDDKISNYMKHKSDEALMMFADPREANNYVNSQLEALSRNAFSQGRDSAEIIYNLASKINGPVTAKRAATPTARGPIPNLDAISNNQKKSATAPTNNSAGLSDGIPTKFLSEDMKAIFTDEKKFKELHSRIAAQQMANPR